MPKLESFIEKEERDVAFLIQNYATKSGVSMHDAKAEFALYLEQHLGKLSVTLRHYLHSADYMRNRYPSVSHNGEIFLVIKVKRKS